MQHWQDLRTAMQIEEEKIRFLQETFNADRRSADKSALNFS
jgi:hypothetical protein